MAEEIIRDIEDQEEEVQSPEEVLRDLKENSVPKTEYDKLQTKYNKLFRDVAEGRAAQSEEEESRPTAAEAKKHAEELIKELGNADHMDPCQRAEKLCEIDDYYREYEGKSIFEASKAQTTLEAKETADSADNVRRLLDAAIEESEGDGPSFAAFIGRHLNGGEDTNNPSKSRIDRRI